MNDDHDALFATGTATLVSAQGKYARIRCPHCNGQHVHDRASVGSRSVLDGMGRLGPHCM